MTVPRDVWSTVATWSAVFAFIVIAAMVVVFARSAGEDPFDSDEWRGRKADLAGRPTDQKVAERVRSLDLDLRRAYFRRRQRIRTGGTLLLVGLAVFLVAYKRAHRRTRPEPDEPAPAAPDAMRDRRSSLGGRAVAVTGGLLAAGAALLWITTPDGMGVTAEAKTEDVADVAESGPPTEAEFAAQWPFFRGPDGSGVAPEGGHPTAWVGAEGTGIVWKTPIPLPGTNSPVVWGSRVFLTGADARREEVYCLDAGTGAILWKKGLIVAGRREEVPEPMEDTGYAAPTAATDGRRVYAMFASGRVVAFDLDGRQVWLKSFGPFDNTYGHSSSLVLFEGRLILQLDQGYADEPRARLVALGVETGETVWETPREVDTSWASPILCLTPSGPQLVLSATPRVAAYDPRTGAEIWRADVVHGEVGPSPIHRDGVVFAMQEDVGLYAIGVEGQGDVTETHVDWSLPGGASDVTSPVCDGERVYMLTSSGMLTCVRAESGEVIYEEDLGAEFYSSPMISGRTIYLTSMKGVTTTISVGDEFQKTGECSIGEGVVASLAFGPGRIYLRGRRHLFAIGAD